MFLTALKFTTGDREGWSSQSISTQFHFLTLKQSKSYPDFILSLGEKKKKHKTFCSHFSQYHKLKLLLKQNKAKFFNFFYIEILCAYFQKWFVLLTPFLCLLKPTISIFTILSKACSLQSFYKSYYSNTVFDTLRLRKIWKQCEIVTKAE